jgi:hypothetical protein
MSLSKIALFAFGLAAVLVVGFPHANATPRYGHTSGIYAGSFGSDLDSVRFDHAKGYVQGY